MALNDEHGEFADGGRDYAAASAIVDEIGDVTLRAVWSWPRFRLPSSDEDLQAMLAETRATLPDVDELSRLVDRHGMFTVLSVALGWAATRVRDLLGLPAGAVLQPGSVELAYPSRPPARDVDAVVAKLLEHVLLGVDGVPRLYDAADLLRTDGRETARVLVGVLDLCAALRDRAVVIGRRS